MSILIILTGILILLLIYLRWSSYKDQRYFESMGVSYSGNGALRMFINMYKGIGPTQGMNNLYKTIRANGQKLICSKDMGVITLTIVDPELLRSVLVKDFDHFAERRQISTYKNDTFSKMLFAMGGEQWKSVRSKLSPTFTTGKIKRVFPIFVESGKKLVTFLDKEISTNGAEAELDLMEAYSKFTMNIFGSTVCGIDSQAFDKKEPSLVQEMGMRLQFQFGAKTLLKLMIMLTSTKLSNWFGLSLLEKEVEDFFSGVIKSSMHLRQEYGEKPDDFLQLLIEARDDKDKTGESELVKDVKEQTINSTWNNEVFDEDGIVANAIMFIFAGYDTTHSLILFCAYSIAINQQVQDKLRTEIDSVFEANGDKLSYESLNDMNYLDMVINETVRIYPSAWATDRGCTKDYKVPGTDFVLRKGQGLLIPIYGLHHDEEYYPEPEKFDPERFSPENKGKINAYTFLPFGQGPRNCIGMKLGLALAKVAIVHLVHNFIVEPSTRTNIPMKFSKASSLKPDGMYLHLRKIQH